MKQFAATIELEIPEVKVEFEAGETVKQYNQLEKQIEDIKTRLCKDVCEALAKIPNIQFQENLVVARTISVVNLSRVK